MYLSNDRPQPTSVIKRAWSNAFFPPDRKGAWVTRWRTEEVAARHLRLRDLLLHLAARRMLGSIRFPIIKMNTHVSSLKSIIILHVGSRKRVNFIFVDLLYPKKKLSVPARARASRAGCPRRGSFRPVRRRRKLPRHVVKFWRGK